MKLLNVTESNRTVNVGGNFLKLEPSKPSHGLILGNQDLINIMASNKPTEVKFIVTNPDIELQLLSNTKVPLEYIYNPGVDEPNE